MTNLVKQPSALKEYMKCYTKSFLQNIQSQLSGDLLGLLMRILSNFLIKSFLWLLVLVSKLSTETWQMYCTPGSDYKCFVSHQCIKSALN